MAIMRRLLEKLKLSINEEKSSMSRPGKALISSAFTFSEGT
jgi:hypothetical protein